MSGEKKKKKKWADSRRKRALPPAHPLGADRRDFERKKYLLVPVTTRRGPAGAEGSGEDEYADDADENESAYDNGADARADGGASIGRSRSVVRFDQEHEETGMRTKSSHHLPAIAPVSRTSSAQKIRDDGSDVAETGRPPTEPHGTHRPSPRTSRALGLAGRSASRQRLAAQGKSSNRGGGGGGDANDGAASKKNKSQPGRSLYRRSGRSRGKRQGGGARGAARAGGPGLGGGSGGGSGGDDDYALDGGADVAPLTGPALSRHIPGLAVSVASLPGESAARSGRTIEEIRGVAFGTGAASGSTASARRGAPALSSNGDGQGTQDDSVRRQMDRPGNLLFTLERLELLASDALDDGAQSEAEVAARARRERAREARARDAREARAQREREMAASALRAREAREAKKKEAEERQRRIDAAKRKMKEKYLRGFRERTGMVSPMAGSTQMTQSMKFCRSLVIAALDRAVPWSTIDDWAADAVFWCANLAVHKVELARAGDEERRRALTRRPKEALWRLIRKMAVARALENGLSVARASKAAPVPPTEEELALKRESQKREVAAVEDMLVARGIMTRRRRSFETLKADSRSTLLGGVSIIEAGDQSGLHTANAADKAAQRRQSVALSSGIEGEVPHATAVRAQSLRSAPADADDSTKTVDDGEDKDEEGEEKKEEAEAEEAEEKAEEKEKEETVENQENQEKEENEEKEEAKEKEDRQESGDADGAPGTEAGDREEQGRGRDPASPAQFAERDETFSIPFEFARVNVAYTPDGDHDEDLSLDAGDRVVILQRSANGWCYGFKLGRAGNVPTSYVSPIEPGDDDRDLPPYLRVEYDYSDPDGDPLILKITDGQNLVSLSDTGDDWTVVATIAGDSGFFPGSLVSRIEKSTILPGSERADVPDEQVERKEGGEVSDGGKDKEEGEKKDEEEEEKKDEEEEEKKDEEEEEKKEEDVKKEEEEKEEEKEEEDVKKEEEEDVKKDADVKKEDEVKKEEDEENDGEVEKDEEEKEEEKEDLDVKKEEEEEEKKDEEEDVKREDDVKKEEDEKNDEEVEKDGEEDMKRDEEGKKEEDVKEEEEEKKEEDGKEEDEVKKEEDVKEEDEVKKEEDVKEEEEEKKEEDVKEEEEVKKEDSGGAEEGGSSMEALDGDKERSGEQRLPLTGEVRLSNRPKEALLRVMRKISIARALSGSIAIKRLASDPPASPRASARDGGDGEPTPVTRTSTAKDVHAELTSKLKPTESQRKEAEEEGFSDPASAASYALAFATHAATEPRDETDSVPHETMRAFMRYALEDGTVPEGDMRLSVGDTVVLLRKSPGGWGYGFKLGEVGNIPSTYVTRCEKGTTDEEQHLPDYVLAEYDLEGSAEEVILELTAGETLVLLDSDDSDGDGWWVAAKVTGEAGLFPLSFVQPAQLSS